MLLIVGIGILTISVPYFVSRRVRAATRQAATMMNRPGSGILRAITTTELSLLFLGLAVVVVYWIPPVPSQKGLCPTVGAGAVVRGDVPVSDASDNIASYSQRKLQ